MEKITGVSVSKGVAIGPAFVRKSRIPSEVLRYFIEENEVEKELKRLHLAMQSAQETLAILKAETSQTDILTILESQQLMLDDPEFLTTIEQRLWETMSNVEWVIQDYIDSLVYRLSDVNDEYLKSRSIDFYDLMRRILDALSGFQEGTLLQPSILICHHLMPTELLSIPKQYLLGIATVRGGETSHTAIFARSLSLPYVMGISDSGEKIADGNEVILDGNKGEMIVSPDKKTKRYYAEIQKNKTHSLVLSPELQRYIRCESKTLDGAQVKVLANVRVEEEVDMTGQLALDGIGLYCSEFLFLKRVYFSSEEEQYRAYSYALQAHPDSEVIIRTLDVGGEKLLHGMHDESNPILGLRSVRFSFQYADLFHTQLRALLRASVHGHLRMLFPLISTTNEVHIVKEYVARAQDELRAQGIAFAESIPLGIMMEVPSAVMLAEDLASMVDFFSIGTNDLVQYTMAVDRNNELVSHLYSSFEPAVIRMIHKVTSAALPEPFSVTLCGEMAHDMRATALLLGLGLRRFSVPPHEILTLKRRIAQLNCVDCVDLAKSVLGCSTREGIVAALDAFSEAKQLE